MSAAGSSPTATSGITGMPLPHRKGSRVGETIRGRIRLGPGASPTSSRHSVPVEFLLHALAGCVTTTFVLHASARGIAIRELSTQLEGEIDLQGLLGLDDSVSPGYEQIRIRMQVEADCPDEELDALIAYTQRHSPVCNTVCRPVPVTIERVSA